MNKEILLKATNLSNNINNLSRVLRETKGYLKDPQNHNFHGSIMEANSMLNKDEKKKLMEIFNKMITNKLRKLKHEFKNI